MEVKRRKMMLSDVELGIMKSGQFVCLGSLQHLRNRFGTGYGVQVKVAGNDVNRVKNDLLASLPGIEIQGKTRRQWSLLMCYCCH